MTVNLEPKRLTERFELLLASLAFKKREYYWPSDGSWQEPALVGPSDFTLHLHLHLRDPIILSFSRSASTLASCRRRYTIASHVQKQGCHNESGHRANQLRRPVAAQKVLFQRALHSLHLPPSHTAWKTVATVHGRIVQYRRRHFGVVQRKLRPDPPDIPRRCRAHVLAVPGPSISKDTNLPRTLSWLSSEQCRRGARKRDMNPPCVPRTHVR